MKTVSDAVMFKFRGWIGILCLCSIAAAVMLSAPWFEEDSLTDSLLDALAWGCFVVYVTFRLWAILFVGGRKGKELQTQGPYSLTRNPLYFGGFCFALSATLFVKSFSLFAATLLSFALYSRWVIPVEEDILERNFGDTFRAYVSRTPRVFPCFSLYQAPTSVVVNLRAVKGEARHLWLAAAMP